LIVEIRISNLKGSTKVSEQLRELDLQSFDEFFDKRTYRQALNTSPTKVNLNRFAITKTKDLLASLQNQK
jgi:hypothetical protein